MVTICVAVIKFSRTNKSTNSNCFQFANTSYYSQEMNRSNFFWKQYRQSFVAENSNLLLYGEAPHRIIVTCCRWQPQQATQFLFAFLQIQKLVLHLTKENTKSSESNQLERFSIGCRKTITQVITTANQKTGKCLQEPIRTQSKNKLTGQSAGKHGRLSSDQFSFCI